MGVLVVYTAIEQLLIAEDTLKTTIGQLQNALDATVTALATVTEKRDPYTAGHQQRVAELACEIAIEMGLSVNQQYVVRVSSLLHDIGKISVPSEMLTKPGPLTKAEIALIRCHPDEGYDILKNIPFGYPVAEIVLQHHERMDGSGYPRGLKGEAISIEARILAVADVIEAMSSHRPYRPALGIEKAIDEISISSGRFYDTSVVQSAIRVLQQKNSIFNWII